MIIRNFYDDKLAQASYLVGCQATGESIVIDPLRDIAPYLQMAESLGLTITAVTETHIHADFLSGARELAAATGANLYLSDEGPADWKYAFANEPNVRLVRGGDTITIGNLALEVVATPGHTPEHIAFLLTDQPLSAEPHSLFTGDFLFAGDVGRPDLLERAANISGTMEAGAQTLFQSLRKLEKYGDGLLIWSGHGSGSACGKSLGGSPVTSLGYERKTNWALQISDEAKFVDEVLSGQPEPPLYFKEMKRLNKLGPAVLGAMPQPDQVTFDIAQAQAMPLVDVRTREEQRLGFPSGAFAIPAGNGVTQWAGWLLDYTQPILLVATSQDQANSASRDLATIGLDVVAGWVSFDEVPHDQLMTMPAVEPGLVTDEDYILDIRGINEWNAGHLVNAHHIPLGYLATRIGELPRDRRIVVHCASGGRSPIAVSVLKRAGLDHVAEVVGGLGAFEQCTTTPFQFGSSHTSNPDLMAAT